MRRRHPTQALLPAHHPKPLDPPRDCGTADTTPPSQPPELAFANASDHTPLGICVREYRQHSPRALLGPSRSVGDLG